MEIPSRWRRATCVTKSGTHVGMVWVHGHHGCLAVRIEYASCARIERAGSLSEIAWSSREERVHGVGVQKICARGAVQHGLEQPPPSPRLRSPCATRVQSSLRSRARYGRAHCDKAADGGGAQPDAHQVGRTEACDCAVIRVNEYRTNVWDLTALGASRLRGRRWGIGFRRGWQPTGNRRQEDHRDQEDGRELHVSERHRDHLELQSRLVGREPLCKLLKDSIVDRSRDRPPLPLVTARDCT